MMDFENVGFVDCHTHLADSMFEKDIQTVIENSKKVGVVAALVCTVTPSDFPLVLQLCDQYSNVLVPCLGIHPVQKDSNGEQRCVKQEDLDEVLREIERNADRLCAIGEVGLDFQPRITTESSLKDIQRNVLKTQVELANKYDLPLNVHSRSAGKPTIAALKEFGAKAVLMHAFDGKPSTAMEGVKEGYFFSIPPSIVRSDQLKLVKQLPIENIVLETDCPGLGPVKGERNEPANLQISCDYIAKVKNMTPQEVRKITTQTAIRLFPKLMKILK